MCFCVSMCCSLTFYVFLHVSVRLRVHLNPFLESGNQLQPFRGTVFCLLEQVRPLRGPCFRLLEHVLEPYGTSFVQLWASCFVAQQGWRCRRHLLGTQSCSGANTPSLFVVFAEVACLSRASCLTLHKPPSGVGGFERKPGKQPQL